MLLTDMKQPLNTKKINRIMESRFGFSIDFDSLSFKKAFSIVQGINESIDKIKSSQGVNLTEKNPKYMELLMVRESLHRWMIANEKKLITESQIGKSEAILAATDIVDSIQDMLEKVSKMQVEQMPALLDTIRNQIGSNEAESYKATVGELLNTLADTLQRGREDADHAARVLAGEEVDQRSMSLGGDSADDFGDEIEQDMGNEFGNARDDFSATDAAAGGNSPLGREER